MRIASAAVFLVTLCGAASSVVDAKELPASPDISQLVRTYCTGCHNGVMRSPSNAVLDRLDTTTIGANPDVWSRAYRQLEAGTMPPFGAPRPDRTEYGKLLTSIETALGARVQPPTEVASERIAERLATLLWNSTPDAELLPEARRDRLSNPRTLERQVQRMLADDRSEAFVSGFFFPWLGLDQLRAAEPDPKYFPDYDVTLRDAMATETDLFIRSQLRDSRDPFALWDADYTFLNERLARHYNISGVSGPQFRRVTLPTPERGGLLGQASILTVTSHHQRGKGSPNTSPAARAIWVRMHVLGAQPPRPFPGATPVKADLPITPQTRALAPDPCVKCHRNFFPLGYALEHFDAIGAWRTDDELGAVDASGALVDGTRFNGSVELRAGLRQYSDAFRTTVTEKLLLYSAGQPVRGSQPTPETLVRARQVLRASGTPRWSSLIAAIVGTTPLPSSVSPAISPEEQTALVKKYCAVCHSDAAKNGGLSLEQYDAARRDPPLAAMILSKLNNGAMGAAGKGVPDKPTQEAWIESTRAQAVGSTDWFINKHNPVISASIVRAVPPRQTGSPDLPVYRLQITCNPSTRLGEMQLTWSPQPQTGRTLVASADGNGWIEYRVDGKESMGNGGTSQSGHASIVLSDGTGGLLTVPRRSLTIRELFPGESVDFPFSDLNQRIRSQLRKCF